MTKDTATPLDENTRRYYLDVMGIQCWQSLDSQQVSDAGADPIVEHGNRGEGNSIESNSIDSNRDVAAVSWTQLEESIHQCDKCVLHKTRKQALVGRGNQSAELMFVVLSPSARDDGNGIICSDAVNDLFSKMLAAIDINIDDVYISSLLKCAVPANHTISPKEIRSCDDHLKQQIQLIRPRLLVVLGETAVRCLLQKNLSIDDFRAMNPGLGNLGQQYLFESIPVFISYSPEELLQQVEDKRKAWSDLQQLQKIINDSSQ